MRRANTRRLRFLLLPVVLVACVCVVLVSAEDEDNVVADADTPRLQTPRGMRDDSEWVAQLAREAAAKDTGSTKPVSIDRSAVRTLRGEKFWEMVAGSRTWIIKFHSQFCPHSVEMAPKFRKASLRLMPFQQQVVLGEVDCDAEVQLCDLFKITSTPTIMALVPNEKEPVEYKGEMLVKEIARWALLQIPRRYVYLKSLEEAEAFFAYREANPKIVNFMADVETPGDFRALAYKYAEKVDFAVVNKRRKDVVERYLQDHPFPSTIVYTGVIENGTASFNAVVKPEDMTMTEFVKQVVAQWDKKVRDDQIAAKVQNKRARSPPSEL